ncbi:tyrosine-type recombinase/integrase [Desulfofustis limnaeus]|uniref:Integrase n=1 Tax=Desulfofustis limnaeus TaxID=2740163 RepID=A0ABN6MC48_9BACT|nr:integrase arm-type DNA-binding domain-containing protein [Desulfofustis limnaeus]BDD88647.1 integrase [Desulfofustis limnaeus]
MPLTDTAIRNAKPQSRQYKLTDEKGMYLLVNQVGKYFRLDYRYAGKRKTLALGVYPDVKLAEAREKRDEARKMIASGIDPGQTRKIEKFIQVAKTENNFEAIAREWHGKFSSNWARSHATKIIRRLELYIFPYLGARPISEIAPPELLGVLRRVESQGILETAHRAQQNCGQIFRYAIATGRAERDPSADLRGALTPAKHGRMATIIEPKKIGELLRAIDGYQGTPVARCALKLAPLVFVRPGELRHAEWSEIDLDNAEWRIPAIKMKMKDPHIVPLSRQSVEVLHEILPITRGGRYVFPSIRTNSRPMSENTVLAALRRMGFEKEEMSGHGFRAMASTVLHEQGWRSDVIERQLAHAERNSIKAAYNHAQHLPERRKMMQAWADYLDTLKKGNKVVPIFRAVGGE